LGEHVGAGVCGCVGFDLGEDAGQFAVVGVGLVGKDGFLAGCLASGRFGEWGQQ